MENDFQLMLVMLAWGSLNPSNHLCGTADLAVGSKGPEVETEWKTISS